MAPCKVCRKPIRWVKDPRGRKIPLDPDPSPNGEFGLLDPDRGWALEVGIGAKVSDIDPHYLVQLDPEVRSRVLQAYDGPRFRRHSKECAALARMHVSSEINYLRRDPRDRY